MCMGIGAKVTHQLRLGMAVGGNGLSAEMMLKTSNDAQISIVGVVSCYIKYSWQNVQLG